MKRSKNKALELIDKKIDQFSGVLNRANNSNMYDKEYKEVYYGTESVISNLYSKEESMEFRRNVGSIVIVSGRSDFQELQDYKKHIESCISHLKVYRNDVQDFWDDHTVDNEPLLINKMKMLINGVKISWKLIVFVGGIIIGILTLIVLIPEALDSLPVIKELVNSTF